LQTKGFEHRFLKMIPLASIILIILTALSLSEPCIAQQKSNGSQQELFRVSRQARNAESAGNLEHALELWRAVEAIRPGYYSAYNGIRRALIDLKRYDEAIKYIDAMARQARTGKIQLDPLQIAADRTELIFVAQGDSLGQIALGKILTEYKGNPTIYRELSSVMTGLRKNDEAIELLIRGRKETGDQFLFARDLARWYEARMDWEAAIDEYLIYLLENENHSSYVVGALADISSTPHTDSLVVSIISNKAKQSLSVRRLLAALHFRAKRFPEALEQYKIIERDSNGNGKELLEFARMTYEEGEFRLSKEAYTEILSHNPGSNLKNVALLGKGLAALAISEIDTAEIALREILKPGCEPAIAFQAYKTLGDIAFNYRLNAKKAREHFEKAQKLVRSAQVAIDASIEIEIKIALTYEFDEDFETAEKQLNDIARRSSRYRSASASVRFELAKLLIRNGKISKANEALKSIVNTQPASAIANDALKLQIILTCWEDNRDWFVSWGRADFLTFTHKFNEALVLYDSLSTISKGDLRDHSLWQMFEIDSQLHDFESALAVLDKIIEHREALNRDAALFEAGKICSRSLHQPEKAINYFDSILIDHPGSPFADRARRMLKSLVAEA